MRKAVKVMMAVLAAAATASAFTLQVKEYRSKRKKYSYDDCGEKDIFGDDEEYAFTSEEEDELFGMDEYDSGDSHDEGDCYLLKDEVDFVKYMLDGVKNVGTIMNARVDDIERLSRRRNIAAEDKVSEIRCLCLQNADNQELMNHCIEDIVSMMDGKTPDDYYDFILHKEEEKNEN